MVEGQQPQPAQPVSVLTSRWADGRAHDIDRFMELDGYASLDAALGSDPAELVQTMKDSGLRGRGGAGFPTGMKWGFLAKGTGKPTYLVINADESEPGTFKDMELLERDPHALVEGAIVSAYAIGCRTAFIYLRGECGFAGRRLAAAIGQAYDKGLLGKDINGSGFDLDVVLHRGAGAYICGEETALLSSLEGERGQPKLRPPFPAVEGLYRAPTTVNNVETIATVPWIFRRGVEWFRWSLLGTAAVIVLSTDVCIVQACLNFTEFYAHESCGKCTPCREGTDWMRKILLRLETGAGREDDMKTLKDICDSIFGRSFCALGDGATSPIVSALKYFRDEFEQHVSGGGCPFGAVPVAAGAH